MKLESSALTDVGCRRPQNQDAFLIDEELGLYIVCDGMGGHAAGDVASSNATKLTADTVRDLRKDIQRALDKPGGHFKIAQLAADAVRITCQLLNDMATRDRKFAGMGTTLTLLLVVGEKGVLAHVGDSRLYLLRAGELHQLTTDHTLSCELIRSGRIEEGSDEAAKFSHVLTRSIGQHASVDVETLLFDLMPEDRFLLCSDGLSNYFADDNEVAMMIGHDNIDEIPGQLVDLAKTRGGNDNITGVVVRLSAVDSQSAGTAQETLKALENTFLCRGLTLNRRMRLANIGRVRRFDTDEVIVRKGDERTGMYVVISGTCLMRNPGGRSVELTTGSCFGETGLARGGQFQIHVRSTEAVCLLHIGRRHFDGLVRRIPGLGRRLLDNLLEHISCQYDALLSEGSSLADTGVWMLQDDTQT